MLDKGAPVNFNKPLSYETALPATNEQTGISRMLIESGADVNARGWMGRMPPFRAVYSANTAMIELLTSRGADPNLQDKTGRTALMAASELCRYWNMRALLANQADPLMQG